MAKLTNEELQNQLEEANAKLQERDDKIAILEAAKSDKSVEAKSTKTVKVSWKDPKGETVTKSFSTKVPAIRMSDGSGAVINTHALFKLASGESLNDDEKKQSPSLANMTKEAAIATLTAFAKKGAAFLEEAK